MTTERIPEHTSPAPWTEVITEDQKQNCTQEEEDESLHSISIETEFPANNGSPKSTRRNLERAPSSGSLDSAYHSKGFVKYNGMTACCGYPVSIFPKDCDFDGGVNPFLQFFLFYTGFGSWLHPL